MAVRPDVDQITLGVDTAMALFATGIEDEQLCAAIQDALRATVLFSIGYGVGLAAR